MAGESIKVIGLQGVLRTLYSLPPEIVSKRGGPVRSALRKASLLILNEMKANVQKIIDAPNLAEDGTTRPPESTGLLLKNLVTTRQKMPGGLRGERYKIGPRLRTKYPKKSPGAKEVTVVQVARLLETGTERRVAMPWARPAFDAKKAQVPQIFATEINKSLNRIVKKLAKQNGVG
jgi:HK97 gp10 family phage protein